MLKNFYVRGEMIKRWFVVQTKPMHEDRSLFHLKNKGLETYLPKMEVMTFHARRQSMIQKPLFPGYLFVRVNSDRSLNKVRWTQGVVRILLNSIHPVPLGDEVITEIKGMEDCDGIIRSRTSQKYKRVRITRGPFKDITGTVVCWLSERERVKILLDLISYQASVELHPSLIERVA
jgi:transcriptional antiterminator RfaH